MSYAVHLDAFDGPLDLLLQLVESEKLEITTISLVQVTEPFLRHLEEHRGKLSTEELADFLVVAAKLVYLKSKALLPTFVDPSLEEGPDLETQLRQYRIFVEAARRLGELERMGRRAYRPAKRMTLPAPETFSPPSSVTSESLREAFEHVIRRLQPLLRLPQAALDRVMSLEEKMADLTSRVKKAMRLSFHRVLSESQNRAEMVVSFLALLELIKQRTVSVDQQELFEDIHIHAT